MTGREALIKACGDTQVANAIYGMGFVCVPREPTIEMLNGAYYDALEEDAAGVWKSMIGVAEGDLTEQGTPIREV